MPAQAKRLSDPVRLAIRIDEKDGYPQLIQDTFVPGDMFKAVFCVKHLGKNKTNPHYHFAVESYYGANTLMSRLKQIFTKGSGNGHMARKVWDGSDKYIQYCLKEIESEAQLYNDVKVNWGEDSLDYVMIPHNKLMELWNNSKQIVEAIKENTPNKICHHIATFILDNKLPRHDRECFKQICRYLIKKGSFLPNKFQAERWINQVKVEMALIEDARSGGQKSQDDLIEELYQNYFCKY